MSANKENLIVSLIAIAVPALFMQVAFLFITHEDFIHQSTAVQAWLMGLTMTMIGVQFAGIVGACVSGWKLTTGEESEES